MVGKRKIALQIGALMAAGFMATCSGGEAGGPSDNKTQTASSTVTVSTANLNLTEMTDSCGTHDVEDAFRVTNNGTTPIQLSDISIKLWVDDTTAAQLLAEVTNGGCVSSLFEPHDQCGYGHDNGKGNDGHNNGHGNDYGWGHGHDDDGHGDHGDNDDCHHSVGAVTATAKKLTTACGPAPNQQANWEVTITTHDHSHLDPGESWTHIQTQLSLSHNTKFSPGTADWYSPCISGPDYVSTAHSALYVQGNLVTASAGVPPSCVAPAGSQPVPGEAGPGITTGQFPLVGPLPGDTNVTVAIELPLQNQADLENLVDQLYDPTEPQLPAVPDAGRVP